MGCTALETVGDLSSLKEIRSETFEGCTSLLSVGDLSNVTAIGKYGFSGCTKLTSIPNLGSLESVDQFAFSGCESLALLGNLRKLTSFGYSPFVNSPFHNCPNLVLEVLPDSAAEQYAKSYNMRYTYITE